MGEPVWCRGIEAQYRALSGAYQRTLGVVSRDLAPCCAYPFAFCLVLIAPVVSVEAARLVECGAWERGGRGKFVTKAFLVPKGDKWRLVVDLRHLNGFVINKTTKMETLKGLRRLAKRNDYMFSFDLADGYYAIAIHPEDRQYFTVEVDGEFFQFVGLPMGWNLSPHVFCKTMRTLVQELRSPDAPKTDRV